jgi:hypothetical protein
MSQQGDSKPVYLVTLPTESGDEAWLSKEALPGHRAALAFGTREQAERYAVESGEVQVIEIVEFKRS